MVEPLKLQLNRIPLFVPSVQLDSFAFQREHKAPLMFLQFIHHKAQKASATPPRSLVYAECKQHPNYICRQFKSN